MSQTDHFSLSWMALMNTGPWLGDNAATRTCRLASTAVTIPSTGTDRVGNHGPGRSPHYVILGEVSTCHSWNNGTSTAMLFLQSSSASASYSWGYWGEWATVPLGRKQKHGRSGQAVRLHCTQLGCTTELYTIGLYNWTVHNWPLKLKTG